MTLPAVRCFLAIAFALAATFANTGTARAQSCPDPPLFRTVAILGDTQSLSLSASDELERARDWIIANKCSEGIDFVLQVGDSIASGHHLPLPDTCDPSLCPTVNSTYCIANRIDPG
ncbi:MAG: hypothetical protein GY725_26700, partial [bacterium]|nr:hypothetical protein [bacterium]